MRTAAGNNGRSGVAGLSTRAHTGVGRFVKLAVVAATGVAASLVVSTVAVQAQEVPFEASVDFGASNTTPPAGSVLDRGLPFDTRNGFDYGWVDPADGTTPISIEGVGRRRTATPLAGSIIHMGSADLVDEFGVQTGVTCSDSPVSPLCNPKLIQDAIWEIAVPNGEYSITLGAGDPSGGGDPEEHDIEVEGVLIADGPALVPQNTGTPDTNDEGVVEYTGTVTVTDGLLTMSQAATGFNAKPSYINLVEIPAAGPDTPADFTAVASGADTADLSWTSSPGAVDYDVLRDGLVIATVTGTTYQDTPLGAGTYTYSVIAKNGDGVSAPTADVDVFIASLCPPFSTAACDQLAVATPFSLTFDGTEGGLADTGFTLVDAPSDRDVVDQAPAPATPTFTDVPGFEPSLITVDGNLTIDATKGIQFATANPINGQQTSGTAGLNAQLNQLGVAVEGGQQSYELTTTVVAPNFNSGGGSQQGGLVWFVDEDNYIKLVVVRVNNTSNRVQLAVESLDTPTADDPDGFFELNGGTFANGQDVALRMEIDATTGTVTGHYSVAGGTEEQVTTGGLLLPDVLTDGTSLGAGLDPTINAGLFATKRSAPATDSVTATFADFAVTGDETAPEVPTNVVATAGDTTVDVAWDAVADAAGDLAGYNVFVDGVQDNVDVVTGTAYTATGLTNGTEVSITVTSVDTIGNESAESAAATATPADETAPAVPSNVNAVGGDQEVVVTWDAVVDDDPITYDVFQAGVVDAIATGLTVETFTATGLDAETEYSFTVVAVDPSGNASDASDAATATTNAAPDETAPAVPSNVNAVGGDQEVVVTWDAVVDDDPITYDVFQAGVVDAIATGLTVETFTATGLDAETEYSFTVVAVDPSGNASDASDAATATTNAAPDETAPAVPSNVNAVGGDQEVVVTWDAVVDDDPITYDVFQAGVVDAIATGLTVETFTATGLDAETEYSFTVVAVDPSGNASDASDAATATTNAAPDETAPEVPSAPVATAGDSEVGLAWSPVANAAGDLAGYNVLVDGVQNNIALVTGTTYTVTGLSNGTSYDFSVTSVDTTGNESAASAVTTAAPVEPADETAPEVPSAPVATAGDSEVGLAWSPVANAAGDLAGYNVLVDGVQNNIALVTGTTYTVTGLSNGTSYDFSVTSVDTTGNESAASAVTTAAPEAPVVAATRYDVDGDGKADYGVFNNSGRWDVISSSTGAIETSFFGRSNDVAVPDDFNGDGLMDLALFRGQFGQWFVRDGATGQISIRYLGLGIDKPVPADFDGDGIVDLGLYRGKYGQWFARESSTGDLSVRYLGLSIDTPVPADYDGDGITDIAVYRPKSGQWFVRQSSTDSVIITGFGLPGDTPVPGDYDGDGTTDRAVFRNSTGQWFIRQSSTNTNVVIGFGLNGDRPVIADFDGDGIDDLTVFRDGQFFTRSSETGQVSSTSLGSAGNYPVGGVRDTGTVAQGTLTAAPTSVAFDIDERETATSDVTVTGNQATPNATAAESAVWLDVTKGAGNVFTFAADGAAVAPGSYVTTVTFSAPGYTDRTVNVTLLVADVPGTLTPSVTAIDETLIEGNSSSTTVSVTGNEDTPLLTADEDAGWLSAVEVAQGVFDLDIDTDGLAPDVYTETVTFSAPGYDPTDVVVTLTVEALGTLLATPAALDFTLEEGEVDSANVTVTGDADTPTSTATPDAAATWLTATEITAGVFDLEVDTTGLAIGNYDGDVVISAPDYADLTVTVSLEVIAAVPPCSPLSPLPCDQLAVATPFSLDFDGTEGGLADTGFTLVDAPSQREIIDQAPAPATPTFADVPGFEPSLLEVDAGELTITATKGIQYAQNGDPNLQTSGTPGLNALLNGLGVAVEGGQASYELTTTVVAPNFNSGGGSQQGGLYWFIDEDNYIKLVVVRSGNANNTVQLAVESLDAPTLDDPDGFFELNAAAFPNGQDVELRMEIDATTGTVTGHYTVAGGTEQQVTTGGLLLPDVLTDGTSLGAGLDPTINAGLFATKRSAPATDTVTATFADFAVTSVEPAANTAPTVTTIDDVTVTEGEAITAIDVTTDDVDGDVVTVTVAGLPASLSYDEALEQIVGTPDVGTAAAYTVTVTADDGTDTTDATFTLTVEAAPPAAACSPISTLPCGDIAVALPFVLDFAAEAVGVVDADGETTGFTMVQTNSEARRAGDPAISNPDVPGYEPAFLDLDTAAGTLTIDALQGIAYLDPPASSNNNNQINTLGVGFDAATAPVVVSTTFDPATWSNTNSSAQAGVWFGLDEDNYVKLVLAANNTAGTSQVQMLVEENGASDPSDTTFAIDTSGVADTGPITLEMRLDPVAGTVTATYTPDGGTPTTLDDGGVTTLAVPAAFFAGTTLAGEVEPVSFAGIFATNRNFGNTPGIDPVFDDFSIVAETVQNAAPEVLLTGDRTLFTEQTFSIPVSVFDTEGGPVTLTATGLPTGLALVDDSFTESGQDDDASTTISGTLDPAVTAGTFSVDVTVDDGTDSATESFTIDVIDAIDIQVNFQDGDFGAPPAGYLADIGEGYGPRTGADQGTGLTFGWVDEGGTAPLDVTDNARERGRAAIDDLNDTFIHMQYGDIGTYPGSNSTPNCVNNECDPGMWEIAVPDGLYEVTLAVGDQPGGDSVYDSFHSINVESGLAILQFQGTAGQEYLTATAQAGVQDGRLTVSAVGGNNTKINWIQVRSIGTQPFATEMIPPNRSVDAETDTAVSVSVNVPGAGVGVDPDRATSLTDEAIKLFEVTPGGDVEVDGSRGSTGGNDTIAFAPDVSLKENTTYRYVIDGVLDEAGNTFGRFESTFATGEDDVTGGVDCDATPNAPECQFTPLAGVNFEKVLLPTASGDNGQFFTSLQVHDGFVWATTIGAGMKRYEILADGTLGPALDVPAFVGRAAIGLVFDADDPNLAWVTHATANLGGESSLSSSKVSVVDLTNPNAPVVTDVFIGLPRSLKDHLSNSIGYGPSGDGGDDWMYFLQGSNQAAGDIDNAWGVRGETQLTAALLRFDPQDVLAEALANGPIDVTTSELGGTYDPFGADPVLEVYATGIRNAYDFVWHSNGSIYVPTNGTAAGGRSPGVSFNGGTATMSSTDNRTATNGYNTGTDVTNECATRRVDGQPYTGPDVPAAGTHPTQLDFLFNVEEGRYYGHPNPTRCEWVLNGGSDSPSNTGRNYPAGVLPDTNYDAEGSYSLGFNVSPNGVIEYTSESFGGQLEGRLMVIRFSNNNDVLTMQVAPNGDVLGETPGSDINADGFQDPLEIIEDTATGNLYVNQYNRAGEPQQLYLLRVPVGQQAAQVEATPENLVLSATLNGEQPTDTDTITLTNTGAQSVAITQDIAGTDAADYTVEAAGTIPAGGSVDLDVTFDPNGTATGSRLATVTFDTGNGTVAVDLRGLAFQGQFGGEEPTLQEVANVLQLGIDTGWTGLAVGTSPSAQGDEVLEPLFERASDAPVTMTPVAAFAPFEVIPFGWYAAENGPVTLNEVGALANGQQQTLNPTLSSGGTSFDPGIEPFGVYYFSNGFDRTGFTEDDRNDGDNGVFHRARIYPLVGNSFLVAFEDASNGDYQDYVYILDNVVAAGDGPVDPPPTGDAILVNFQLETAPVPADHIRDFGQAYGPRSDANQGTGLTYGWVDDATFEPLSLVGNGRDRDSNADQRLDTLMHMDLPPDGAGGVINDGSWEIALADGSYEVTASVGDPDLGGADETHVINVEGVSAIAGFPKSTAPDGSDARHQQATVTVDVTDGRLTIDQIGGTNTKINYLEIIPVDVVADVVAQVNFQPAGAATPADWLADTGALFDAGRGYGWVRTEGGADKAADTRDRNIDGDQLLDTLVIVDDAVVAAAVNGEWEFALPSGTYTVELSAGDPGFENSTHSFTAEGTTVIDGFVPAASGDYGTGSASVEVNDGFLTIASTGSNAKLQWVRILGSGGIDVIPPQVDIQLAGDGDGDTFTGDVTVTLDITDASLEFVDVTVDGVQDTTINATNFANPFDVTGSGEHTVEVVATDGAGNSTTESVTFEIIELGNGQLGVVNPEAVILQDRLVMSRLQSLAQDPKFNDTAQVVLSNDGTEAITITDLVIADPGDFDLVAPPTLPITIAVGADVTLTTLFDGVGTDPDNELFESTLTVVHDGANGPAAVIELAGQWQVRAEQGNEPNVAEIVAAFGLGTTIVGPGQQINNQGRLETIGDEVLSQYWELADETESATVRQLAAYHSCCTNTATFKTHVVGAKGNQTNRLTHDGEWAQTLLPRINGSDIVPAFATFNPAQDEFAISIDPESSAWTLNNTGPDNCGANNAGCQLGHHLRFWPAEDRAGIQVPNAWIVVMDYSGINYDFNDNVYLVEGIRPLEIDVAGAPEAPTGLQAQLNGSNVSLDWDVSADLDLDVYAVERSIDGGAFVRIADDVDVSSFGDATAPADSDVAYRIVAIDRGGAESAPSATASVTTPPVGATPLARVNAGGPAVTTGGVDWDASAFMTGGKVYVNTTPGIAGTTDDVLYHSEYSTETGQIQLDVPVTNGTYDVRLHFAEIYFQSPGGTGAGGVGSRVFDVNVEGVLELDNYDIIADVGPTTATIKTFTVVVTDGNIDVDLTSVVNQAKLSAFEIVPVAG